MKELQVFKNPEFGQVRGKLINGQPYVVLTDVCKILGLNNVSQVKTRLKKDGVITNEVIDSLGRKQTANFIDESNLYRVIFQSRKKEAEKFTDWVVEEVLPSIRKHGIYATPQAVEAMLNDPDTMIKTLQALKKEREEKQKLQQQIERDKPKVLFADAVTTSKNSVLVGELAKLLRQNGVDIGQNRLFKWLRNNGYLGKSGENYNLPTQYAMDLELFEIKKTVINNPDGSQRVTRTPKVTGKGQIYFVNKFNQLMDKQA